VGGQRCNCRGLSTERPGGRRAGPGHGLCLTGGERELPCDQGAPLPRRPRPGTPPLQDQGLQGGLCGLLTQYRGTDHEIVDHYFAKHIHAGALHVCRITRFRRRRDFEIRLRYPGTSSPPCNPSSRPSPPRAPGDALLGDRVPARVLDSVESLAAAGRGTRGTEECSRLHRIEKTLEIAQGALTRLQEFADQAAIIGPGFDVGSQSAVGYSRAADQRRRAGSSTRPHR
jgi:hypothetical protein